MDAEKWRIKKNAKAEQPWGIFPPGRHVFPAARTDTHTEAIELLPHLQKWDGRGFQ